MCDSDTYLTFKMIFSSILSILNSNHFRNKLNTLPFLTEGCAVLIVSLCQTDQPTCSQSCSDWYCSEHPGYLTSDQQETTHFSLVCNDKNI